MTNDPRDISERTFGPGDLTERISSGYEGTNVPDLSIPTCGLEDVDRALFNLFNTGVKFNFKDIRGAIQPIPVIFAGSERFAMLKQKKPLRDDNEALILPLISINRKEIDQSEDLGGLGRGIGQDTGDLYIKTRLDKTDRRYQSLKNKLALLNQTDVAAKSHGTDRESTVNSLETGNVGTRRSIGSQEFDKAVGQVLKSDLNDNIFEFITIPFPEFFSVKYEIVFWSQYQQQMNTMIEQMMSAYHAQGNQFRIDTDKGYWFVAFIDDTLSTDNNFQDYTESERIIKTTFSIKTTGYLVAPLHEGGRLPLRRFVSAPSIDFDVIDPPVVLETTRPLGNGTGDVNAFLLSDVAELDRGAQPVLGRNHSTIGQTAFVPNPFTGGTEREFLRVKTRYQRGETVFSEVPFEAVDLFDATNNKRSGGGTGP